MKISIITVCLNAEDTIKETLYSVASQTYSNIEHIIIDGKSEDNTLGIINDFMPLYQNKSLKIVSEKDSGIYDAMNKGVLQTTGDYLLFLNANDKLLHNKVIEKIIEKGLNSNKDMVFGTFCWLNPSDGSCGFKKQTHINRFDMWQTCPIHSTLFYKKELFEKYGLFDTSFNIAGDMEWNCRVFSVSKPSLLFVDMPITLFYLDGISSKLDYSHKKERERIEQKYFSKFELFVYNLINTSKRRKYARNWLFGKIFAI